MARFLVFHQPPAEATQDELIAAARQLNASLTGGVEWLNSWWLAGEDGKFLCEWEAEDEEAIVAALEPFKELCPIESVQMATWMNPEWHKQ